MLTPSEAIAEGWLQFDCEGALRAMVDATTPVDALICVTVPESLLATHT